MRGRVWPREAWIARDSVYLDRINTITLMKIGNDARIRSLYIVYTNMKVNFASVPGPWPHGLSTKDLVQSKVRLNFRH